MTVIFPLFPRFVRKLSSEMKRKFDNLVKQKNAIAYTFDKKKCAPLVSLVDPPNSILRGFKAARVNNSFEKTEGKGSYKEVPLELQDRHFRAMQAIAEKNKDAIKGYFIAPLAKKICTKYLDEGFSLKYTPIRVLESPEIFDYVKLAELEQICIKVHLYQALEIRSPSNFLVNPAASTPRAVTEKLIFFRSAYYRDYQWVIMAKGSDSVTEFNRRKGRSRMDKDAESNSLDHNYHSYIGD